MRLSLRKYMLVDLGFLTLVGCVLEALATKIGSGVFNSAPTITFSLLILFITVARWNLWGLLPIPFLALANSIGGHFSDVVYVAAVYDWKIYISNIVGLIFVGINVIFFNKIGTKKTINTTLGIFGLLILDYVLCCFVQVGVYRILTSGSPFKIGEELFQYIKYETIDGNKTSRKETVNLCLYSENEFTYNLFGFVVAILGSYILRSQGALTNAVEKLVCDKKEAEAMKNDENFTFNLPDADEAEASNFDSEDTTDSNEIKF